MATRSRLLEYRRCLFHRVTEQLKARQGKLKSKLDVGFTTPFEPLEPRVFLSAEPLANAFAQFNGEITNSGGSDSITITVSPDDFSLRGRSTDLSLHVATEDGGSLDPDAVVIHDINGKAVRTRYHSDDTVDGNDSLVLAKLWAGVYTITIAAADNTSGAYVLEVGLTGDVNGDHTVDQADRKLLRKSRRSQAGDPHYLPQADVNRDGKVTGFDHRVVVRNRGDSTGVRVLAMDLTPDLSKLEDLLPDSNNRHLLLRGHTSPGAIVSVDLDANGFDDQPLTAGDSGGFTLSLPLDGSATEARVRVEDLFGQTTTTKLDLLLETSGTTDQAIASSLVPLPFDFNVDDTIDTTDIDTLAAAIRSGTTDLRFDLDASGVVDIDDHTYLITSVMGTVSGDLNLDRDVTVADLSTFALNFGAANGAGWAQGDNNTDGAVSIADLSSLALQFGHDGPEIWIVAALGNDTAPGGVKNFDTVTSDATVTGLVSGVDLLASLKAGFNDTPESAFVDILGDVLPDGRFELDHARLIEIAGSSLADGPHTLHLLADNGLGGLPSMFDLSFTLDTTPSATQPTLELDGASDTLPVGDNQTALDTVTLIGTTDPNTFVELSETGTTTISDGLGQFQFVDVALSLGANNFTAEASDTAGNITSFMTTFHRVPTGLFADPDLEEAVRETLQIPDGVELTTTDLLDLTMLRADSNLIDSLIGLEHAHNLRELIFNPSNFSILGRLSSLAPLSGLNSLTTLSLQRAGIDSLELGTLGTPTSLQSLDLRYNQLTDVLAVASLPTLQSLSLYGNPITDLGAVAGSLIQIDLPPADLHKATTIADLADALYMLPIEMFEYVVNSVEYQPYAGAMKGAQATLETGVGNDWDQALFLAELLGEAGVNTQFVSGQIEVPIETAMDYVGATEPGAAGDVLANAGVNPILIVDELGGVVAMRFDHTWLEAELNVPGEGIQWVGMDPSWKFREFQPGLQDVLTLVPFDESGYLNQTRNELAHEYYEDQVRAYLAVNEPGISVADVAYDGPIIPQLINRIPESLPFNVLGPTTINSTVPTTMMHRVRVTLLQGGTLFTTTLNMPDSSLDRLTISYAPVGGGLVTPEFRIDGAVALTGSTILNGSNVQLILEHFDPGDNSVDRSFTYDRFAGQYLAIGLDAQQISHKHLLEQRHIVNDAALAALNGETVTQENQIGALLYMAVMTWFHDTNMGEAVIDSLTRAVPVFNSVASGITTSDTTLDFFPDLQIPYVPEGVNIDVANNFHLSLSVDDDPSHDSVRDLLSGHNSSAYEHAVWENLVNIESISTIKSLQLANERGIPVFVIDSSNAGSLIPQLNHPISVINSVNSEVSGGATVTIPRDPTPLQDWDGVGYITRKITGAGSSAGYIISGGLNSSSNQTPLATYQGGSGTGDPDAVFVIDPDTGEWVQVYAGDPVNIANGNVKHDETDIILPGIGLPLQLTRSYDSMNTVDRGMGEGWSFSYSDRLEFETDGSIVWRDGTGNHFRFTPDGMGGFNVGDSIYGTFTDTGSGFLWRDKHGMEHLFDTTGQLLRIQDRYGNGYEITYGTGDQISMVRDLHSPSRALTFTYTGGLITSISDFTGRTWSYSYTGDRLSQVTAPSDAETPLAIVQYSYYTDTARDGLLKQITQPNGGTIEYTYYANRRGFEVTDPESYTHDLSYNTFRNQTAFTDERGNTTFYNHNDQGNLIRLTHPDRSTQDNQWLNNLMQSTTDAFGHVESYEYDTFGNLEKLTDRAGVVIDYTYDLNFSNLIQEDRFGGRTSVFEYDAKGNMTKFVDAEGNEFTMTYDPRGLFESRTRPKGNLTLAPGDYTTTYTYNDAGQVLTESTDLPATTTYTYDSMGNRTSATDPNFHTTSYKYDLLNQLILTTDPLNRETSFTYDAMGDTLTFSDQLGRVTAFDYDLKGNTLRAIYPDTSVITNQYNPVGDMMLRSDALGRTTEFTYDQRNRLDTVQYADGATERNDYDGLGRLVEMTDSRGFKTKYTHDELGRRVSVVDEGGDETTWTYDEVGNVLTVTDPLLNTTTYRYDLLDRVKEVEDALNKVTSFTYDPHGNTKTTTDPLLRTITYDYDVQDRQISETNDLSQSTMLAYDPVGNIVLISDPLGHKTSFHYDQVNRQIAAIEDPDNLAYTTLTTYDDADNILTIKDPENNTTSYSYDTRNRVTAEINELGLARTFQYDAVGNEVSTTDRNGRERNYTYDVRNRQTTESWLNATPGYTITRTFDRAGNLLQAIDPAATNSYGYDAKGQLVSATTEYTGVSLGGGGPLPLAGTLATTDGIVMGGGSQGYLDVYNFDADLDDQYIVTLDSTEFDPYLILIAPSGTQYHDADSGSDANSRIELTIDEAGTWTVWATSFPVLATGSYILTIDDGSLPGLTINYTYDEAGNITSIVDSHGGANDYIYDKLNRVERITQSGTGVADKRVDFVFDDAGQMTGIGRYADPAGAALVAGSLYAYDTNVAGRLTGITHSNSTATLADYTWTHDDAGRITQMTSPDGTSDFTYDDTDQLTAADHNYQTNEDYGYDSNGNRTNAGYVTGDNNRLLSNGNYNYDYDNEGNLITQTDISTGAVRRFSWDHRNRLISVTDEDGFGTPTQHVAFTYDAFDRRIAKAVDGNPLDIVEPPITTFVYNGDEVWLEFVDDDGAGPNDAQMNKRYFHGPLIDQILAEEDVTGTVEWMLVDHLGTIRDIVDNDGTVLNHLSYDSFGNITAQSDPAVKSRYGFAGREFDSEIGLHYNRARYFDSTTGRFLSEDPTGFDAGDANLYRYVGNHPTLFTDPQGLSRTNQWETGSYWGDVGQVFLGYGDAVAGIATGLWQIVAHPIQTAKGIGYAATHPGETWDAISSDYADRTKTNRGMGSIVGEVLITVATAGAGVAANSGGKVGQTSRVINTIDKVVPEEVAPYVDDLGKVASTNATKNVGETVVRTTRGGDKAVRITKPDGSVIDISPQRVKEFVPNTNPKAPPGTLQKVKFDNSLPGSKGYKRPPTQQELEILKNAN